MEMATALRAMERPVEQSRLVQPEFRIAQERL
jgi:hypothetical protein